MRACTSPIQSIRGFCSSTEWAPALHAISILPSGPNSRPARLMMGRMGPPAPRGLLVFLWSSRLRSVHSINFQFIISALAEWGQGHALSGPLRSL